MRTAEELFVRSDGTILVIGDAPKELELIGDTKRKRASHIVPFNGWKRFWFMFLRHWFGERGVVAEWTRGWEGPWVAVIIATGEAFTHQSRRVCLAWERQRLEELLVNN